MPFFFLRLFASVCLSVGRSVFMISERKMTFNAYIFVLRHFIEIYLCFVIDWKRFSALYTQKMKKNLSMIYGQWIAIKFCAFFFWSKLNRLPNRSVTNEAKMRFDLLNNIITFGRDAHHRINLIDLFRRRIFFSLSNNNVI